MNVSIGIDIIDENVEHSDHILNNADTAMYRSKKSGKNKTTLFADVTDYKGEAPYSRRDNNVPTTPKAIKKGLF
ncbi:MAG: diguanylate cyclase [Sulfurimonas sp.]|nr:diguanylate cyclase [Sulfurimonas sp.]